ncbi:MAG: xanthine dehydrogenase family protein molybdopterin-binding subunit [Clostridia bacterium]|nr:xanthine dehydrogenase family protein molybdopterin-binding subunit [Clostridia bacterium]
MPEVIVGQPVTRVEALEKVTGVAVYGADVSLPGMLYAKVLRSPYAHARIKSIDISSALKAPGVRAVVTGEDLPGVLGGEAVKDMPFLAQGKVRYVGEPVAAVAAEDEAAAERALELIRVEYEELPAVLDPLEAMKDGAPLIHPELAKYQHIPAVKPVPGTNILSVDEFGKGDVEAGFAEADYIFEDTFTSHIVQHAPIEPHSVVAQVAPNGKITLWVPNDGPHRLRKDLSDALRIPLHRIRVISTYIGGGFGCKGGLKAEPVAIALALKANYRPVKLVLSREEVFEATIVRHATVITIKTGVKRDGTLVAREVRSVWDTGAYAEKGPTVCRQSTATSAGPYRIPHTRLVGYCVYTNKVIAGAYRGYGTPQVTWAYESQMDIIARKLGLDPLEFRLKNILREGDINATGQVAHSVGVEECLRRAAAAVSWEKQNRPRVTAEGKYRGVGIACAGKNTKTPSGSAAFIQLNQDGTANVLTSTVEIGQGAKTIFAQIAAEVLGIPVEKVEVSGPDTDLTPFDASTTSSRSTFHMGNAVKLAAEDIIRQLRQLAAAAWDCPVEQVTMARGQAEANGQVLTYQDIIKKHYGAGGSILGRGFFYPPEEKGSGMWSSPSVFWMYSAHAVEVEVDPETGLVEVVKLAAAQDVGRPINPLNCLQQVEGGGVHGVGTAVMEQLLIDSKGRVLNPNLHDYKIPTAMDAPQIEAIIVEAPHRDGPFGAKGIGEVVITPTMPAVANAIEDAIGVRIKDLPLTPEKILKALQEKGDIPQAS